MTTDDDTYRREFNKLFIDLGLVIKTHLFNPDGKVYNQERVYQVLNVLAIHAATVLAGTGPDELALKFFFDGLEKNITSIAVQTHETPPQPWPTIHERSGESGGGDRPPQGDAPPQ
jgi:hypothetical protein